MHLALPPSRKALLSIAAVFGIAVIVWYLTTDSATCNVAYIKLHGDVVTYVPDSQASTSQNSSDQTSSEDVTSAIRAADRDPAMRAIVLEIDSPGGSPVGGEEIETALKDSSKPTVALIRDLGDSAAYMAATGADTVFASAFSDVGDIGITQSYVDTATQNKDNGLTFNQLSIGKYKDMFNTDKPLTPDERALAMKELEVAYQRFVQIVSDNRHLSISAVTRVADGSSLTGQEAVDSGLIDTVGGIADVRSYLTKKLQRPATICNIDTPSSKQ